MRMGAGEALVFYLKLTLIRRERKLNQDTGLFPSPSHMRFETDEANSVEKLFENVLLFLRSYGKVTSA